MDTSNVNELEQLGSFEISDQMLKLAQKNQRKNIFLNAGRGNPNWINKKARLAFNRLVEFGVQESERTLSQADLVGCPEKEGILKRFKHFLTAETETDHFLLEILDYTDGLKIDNEDLVKELIDGVLGNNYPVPSRVLKNSELILNQYLESTLYNGTKLADQTQIFPTEGGTAAIVYIFQSLKANKLIQPGDRIAINTPIFTPYLQIPELADYELVEVDLHSTEENHWDLLPEEIDRLNDAKVKALFIVNPSNPGSKALNSNALAAIREVVQKNPDLMIITDDVYGTFVEDFQTIYAVAPYNTLLVYSFSKLFGATGWRLGLIAAHKDNVFDRLIRQLPEKERAQLIKRYDLVVLEPEKLPFIERMVADSRSIGLYHTAGLSTPQQIMEVLFALTHLLAGDSDPYIETSRAIIAERYKELFAALQLPTDDGKENSKYYTLVNIYQLAEERYGKEFRHYLATHFEYMDFLKTLAEKEGVVLIDAVGFGAIAGELRVSEANLPAEDYRLIGHEILKVLKEYHDEFLAK
ncbi:bifunctional aspartate transaminase/aspartate 4-decarboxylase [Enterococcus devriesei]|uniref:Aminotransferase n=1 Tax=Enterococcus devriesei TaxID=319970 RepID=A0A1L8SQC7_9ENTE|nr:bifunctional aspartate transaminase/aspartate 4-decarboxylase [Enterococcus devriesei]OJG34287.1 aspartate 4-decarboxylase [Enterococcus devriesei]